MKYSQEEAIRMTAEIAVNSQMNGYTKNQIIAEIEESLEDYNIPVNEHNVKKVIEVSETIPKRVAS